MPPGNGKSYGTSKAASGETGTYTTTIEVNGFSVLGNAATSNAPAANGGLLRVHKGTDVFEADDIIVFTVENTTIDGVLTDDSVITGVQVYENAYDFMYGAPKYTYAGTAEIDVGRKTMGDGYLEFDAEGLVSTDPSTGAPDLEGLTVIAGVNIRAELDANKHFDVPTFEDIDTDGDGVVEPGDGIFSGDLSDLLVVCFAAGTLIETPQGPRYVESLQAGDMVNTLDDGPQEIRWIGKRRVHGTGPNAPVRLKPGALGNLRRLYVSQNHRLLVAGPAAELLFGQAEVLVAAKHLVNDDSIRIVQMPQIEYVHFLFDRHQIVFAECCPAESLYPGPQTLGVVEETARDEIIALFPELQHHQNLHPMSRYALKRHEALALRAIA